MWLRGSWPKSGDQSCRCEPLRVPGWPNQARVFPECYSGGDSDSSLQLAQG